MTQDTEDVVEMIRDLRDPLLQLAYHYRERIAETLTELNNRAFEAQSLSDRIDGLRDALERILLGEVGGDPAEPFSGYMCARKIALETVKADSSAALHQEATAP